MRRQPSSVGRERLLDEHVVAVPTAATVGLEIERLLERARAAAATSCTSEIRGECGPAAVRCRRSFRWAFGTTCANRSVRSHGATEVHEVVPALRRERTPARCLGKLASLLARIGDGDDSCSAALLEVSCVHVKAAVFRPRPGRARCRWLNCPSFSLLLHVRPRKPRLNNNAKEFGCARSQAPVLTITACCAASPARGKAVERGEPLVRVAARAGFVDQSEPPTPRSGRRRGGRPPMARQ